MEQSLPAIKARGLGLAAISYDSTAVLSAFAGREHISYPLLSDPDSRVIGSYGIRNETVAKDSPTFGIPYPGTYVLDKRGVVIGKYFEDDYKVRDTAASVLLRQFGIASVSHQSVQAKHLTITLPSLPTPVRPGQRITLAVDVALPPRIHVYAPGVTGYIPIRFSLQPSRGFQAEPVSYPKARKMKLAAIHETALVYERSLRLIETVTLANAPEIESLLDRDRNLKIEGELLYQACDDRECFLPETVPVSWIIQALPFDRTRVPEPLRRRP